eukprot:892079-Rhodomonas_salina.1
MSVRLLFCRPCVVARLRFAPWDCANARSGGASGFFSVQASCCRRALAVPMMLLLDAFEASETERQRDRKPERKRENQDVLTDVRTPRPTQDKQPDVQTRSQQVLSPQSYDDDLGAKVKERLELLKTFSLPACNEPRRRQAQPRRGGGWRCVWERMFGAPRVAARVPATAQCTVHAAAAAAQLTA